MAPGALKSIGDGLADFVDSVREQLEDDLIRRAIAEDLGLQPGESLPKADLPQQNLDGLARYRSQANPDKEAFVVLLNDVRAVYEACRLFISSFGAGPVSVHNELLYRMFDLMAANYFRIKYPREYFLAQAIAALVEDSSELVDQEAAFARIFDTLAKVVAFALSPLYYIFRAKSAASEADARRISERLFPHIAAFMGLSGLTDEVIYGWDTFENPAQLHVGLVDIATLAVKLRDRSDPLVEYLHSQRLADTQRLITEYDAATPPTQALRQALSDEFELRLRDAALYDDERFARLAIAERTRAHARQRPQGDELIRLNLDLLEAAFPDELSESDQPLADAIAARALTLAFPISRAPTAGSALAGAVTLTLQVIPSTGAQEAGLLLSVGGGGEMELALSRRWKFLLAASAESAFSIFFKTGDGPLDTALRLIAPATGHGPLDAPLNVALVTVPDASNVTFALPDADGTRLEVGQLAFSFGFNGESGQISAQAKRCALVIASKDQDGFLAKILAQRRPAPPVRLRHRLLYGEALLHRGRHPVANRRWLGRAGRAPARRGARRWPVGPRSGADAFGGEQARPRDAAGDPDRQGAARRAVRQPALVAVAGERCGGREGDGRGFAVAGRQDRPGDGRRRAYRRRVRPRLPQKRRQHGLRRPVARPQAAHRHRHQGRLAPSCRAAAASSGSTASRGNMRASSS